MPKVNLSVLEKEFLQKVADQPRPASVPEMNAGYAPKWNQDAADALLLAGLVVDDTWDHVHNAPRYAITPAGREVLALPAKAPEPVKQAARAGYTRRYGSTFAGG